MRWRRAKRGPGSTCSGSINRERRLRSTNQVVKSGELKSIREPVGGGSAGNTGRRPKRGKPRAPRKGPEERKEQNRRGKGCCFRKAAWHKTGKGSVRATETTRKASSVESATSVGRTQGPKERSSRTYNKETARKKIQHLQRCGPWWKNFAPP